MNNNKINYMFTIWDNAEFGCELAYIIAKYTDLSVVLLDLDLLAPKVDLNLNVKKYPEKVFKDSSVKQTGLKIIMDAIENNYLSVEVITKASVKRDEVKNLFVITSSYDHNDYEYFDNDSIATLLEKLQQNFDVSIVLVNRCMYDYYTLCALYMADYNLVAVNANIGAFREFNSYMTFLSNNQNIDASKMRFVAFNYDKDTEESISAATEMSNNKLLGTIRYSRKRAIYRKLKTPYSKVMEPNVLQDYFDILSTFGIVTKTTLRDRARSWFNNKKTYIAKRIKISKRRAKR